MKKAKLITTSIFISLACLLLFIGGGVVFAINFNTAPTPSVNIIDDGSDIYVQTQMAPSYVGYRFKFNSLFPGEPNFECESKSNIISLSEVEQIIPSHTYDISVCYLGEIEGANSSYSKSITWSAVQYLDSPKITYDSDENRVTWGKVKNATSYLVYYGSATFEIDSDSIDSQQDKVVFDLQPIKGGIYDIFVIARGGEGYLDSNPSNALHLTITHKLSKFKQVSFNSNQLILSVISTEEVPGIKVIVRTSDEIEKEYVITGYTTSHQNNGDIVYSFPITAIYDPNAEIGVVATGDEYNLYTEEPIYISLKNA